MALEGGRGGEISLAAPNCPKGGYVMLKAEAECVVVMSACPMDLNPMYGGKSREAEFEILSGYDWGHSIVSQVCAVGRWSVTLYRDRCNHSQGIRVQRGCGLPCHWSGVQ